MAQIQVSVLLQTYRNMHGSYDKFVMWIQKSQDDESWTIESIVWQHKHYQRKLDLQIRKNDQ